MNHQLPFDRMLRFLVVSPAQARRVNWPSDRVLMMGRSFDNRGRGTHLLVRTGPYNSPSGGWDPYTPTEFDLAASDWIIKEPVYALR